MDSALNRVEVTPMHCRPDSERLLRTHNAWQASWDESNKEEAPDIDTLVKVAFSYYSDGYLPVQVKWRLSEEFPHLPPRTVARIQRRAEDTLTAAETAPPDLRRAMVAAARQRVIQAALAAGQYGAALKALDRAGEIAGELRESAGLADEDLILTVTVEQPALPAGESQPVATETADNLTIEMVETEAESY
jgi:hypothetical protein